MDFSELLSLASKKQKTVEKSNTAPKRYDTSIPPPKRDVKKKPVGVQSVAVRAFLEKQKKEKRQKELSEKRKSEEFRQQYEDSKKRAGAKGIVVNKPVEKKPDRFRVPKISKKDEGSSEKSDRGSKSNVGAQITTKLVHPSARKSGAEPKPSKSHNSAAKEKPGLFTTFKEKGAMANVSKATASGSREAHKAALNAKVAMSRSEGVKVTNSRDKNKTVKRPPASGGKGPMSFADILKLAQKKDTGKGDVGADDKKDAKMPNRPMTQEEKDRWARKQTKEYQDWYQYGPSGAKKDSGASGNYQGASSKADKSKSFTKVAAAKTAASNKVENKGNGAILKKMLDKSKTNSASLTQASVSRSASPGAGRPPLPQAQEKKQLKYAETRDNVLVCRPASSGAKNDSEDESNLSAWDKIYKKMNKNRPVKRKFEEEEEEGYEEGYGYEEDYEEDLEGFIDDGPLENEQRGVSKYIREIFGYDKRKFRFEREDDIDNMETNFASQMKEEARSARLGREEDLEDIKQEQLMEKRKALMKKMKK